MDVAIYSSNNIVRCSQKHMLFSDKYRFSINKGKKKKRNISENYRVEATV